jgi:hypothetical protein
METNEKVISKEKDFCDKTHNGFVMLIVCLIVFPLIMAVATYFLYEDHVDVAGGIDGVLILVDIILL